MNLADKSTNFTAGINIDKLFEQALKEIYAEYGIDPKDMPPVSKPLFDITNKSLQQGIENSFSVAFGESDPEFINQFKTNAAVFSAFKTHAQGKEIIARLMDEKGELRSFDKFRKAVLGTSIKADYLIKGIENIRAHLYRKNGVEEIGYYAQDAQPYIPSAVRVGQDGKLVLSYTEVLVAKVASLEARVKELESRLNHN